jgi:hypothetical protein
MGRGPADEAVVVVKVGADEDAVTYPRVKLPSSDPAESRIGDEGWNMCPRFDVPLETIAWRLARKGAVSGLNPYNSAKGARAAKRSSNSPSSSIYIRIRK